MTPARRPLSPPTAPAPPTPSRALGTPIFVALIAGVALALRLLHVFQLRGTPFFDVLLGDARGYDEWARRIAGGEWLGREVFYQAPLYPYFLGVLYTLFGHSLLAVRIAQAVLGAGSCVFVGLAARQLFSPRVGLVAGLGLAFYAPAIFFDGLLQKATLDLFFVSLAVWLVARLGDRPGRALDWLSLGGALGALSLTRENALVIIAVLFVWVFTRGARPSGQLRSRLADAGLMLAGLSLVLVPVAARNYAVGGGFYLTTSQFGPNFYIGNNPRSDGTYMSLRFGRGAPEYERIDATELAEHATGRHLTPAEVSSYWTDQALDFITTQPAAWLRLTARKALLLVSHDEMLDTESQESYAEFSWPLRLTGWFSHFGVLVPLGLLGAMLTWPHRRRLAVFYTLTVVYSASVVAFYVFARYRLPLVPLLMLFSAAALSSIAGWLTGRLPRPAPTARTVAATAVILGAVVASNWPLLSGSLMRAITENNLATALQAEGRGDAAMVHFDRAIALRPDYAPTYNNKGVALRARGDVDGAIASYRQALAINADYPDAHYNLANALLARQEPREAAQHFEIALRSIPDSAGVRNNLGIALAAQGRTADAISAFRAAVQAEPGSAIAHRNLGDALADAGQVGEAVVELRRAIALAPDDPASHYNLGNVLLNAGRFDEAITAFLETLRVQPRSAEALNNLGIAYGSKGDLDQAIVRFRQALAVDPQFADAQRNLATALGAAAQSRRRP